MAQSFVSISQEKISSKFGDKLRNQFLKLIIFSSSKNLNKTSRGELFSLLMVDITRSVSSLDQFLKSLDSI